MATAGRPPAEFDQDFVCHFQPHSTLPGPIVLWGPTERDVVA